MQQLAARLAAPVAPQAPKSPTRARRPRPSTMQQSSEDSITLTKEPEKVLPIPLAPPAATPKSAPTRKRRPAPAADMQTFRMDTDTEETPSKQATDGLAKEFAALDAELYSLDAPARPVTPKSGMKSPRSRGSKPVSAMMLDLADDSDSMLQARVDVSVKQKEFMEDLNSHDATSFNTVAPSKRALSLGSKHGLQGGKVLPALTPRRSHALVESGNRMANQVSMTSTPRGRYF